MATRFYGSISKEKFLDEVKAYMSPDDYPRDGDKISKDLSKVNFNWENYTDFDTPLEEGFGEYPVGYEEIAPGFHIFYAHAGGDWEFPICFIYYWDGKELRAYIPKEGNVWNKKEKCAYGSGENEDDGEDHSDEYNYNLMKKDILYRIVKK